jgi:APA family basic amino acid/polyamine antiporter
LNLKRELSSFDLTSIVVGSMIGADIYIMPALVAGMMGPAGIFVWIIAGIFAVVIALVFSYTSYYVPRVGGPFAFASKAFGNFYGFVTGWAMLSAEMMALPVFAILFTRYLNYFVELELWEDLLVKGLFLFSLTFVNIIGVKVGGRVNDALTILKLCPLVLVIVSGIIFLTNNPEKLIENYTPIAPLGFDNFGTALVLVFWAFAGFEMGTIPASEVKSPRTIIPKAIIFGIITVILFYLTINFVVYGSVNWNELSRSTFPLVLAGSLVIGYIGATIVGFGALTSVSGSGASFSLGVSRIYYAMSIKGLLPKIFSNVHKKYKTPYMALIIQGIIAFFLSAYGGLTQLISFSVFNLAFIALKKEKETKFIGQRILPFIGISMCVILIYYTSVWDKIIGSISILIGIGFYSYFLHRVKRSSE